MSTAFARCQTHRHPIASHAPLYGSTSSALFDSPTTPERTSGGGARVDFGSSLSLHIIIIISLQVQSQDGALQSGISAVNYTKLHQDHS
jgi:hypothetical protein